MINNLMLFLRAKSGFDPIVATVV